MKLVIVVVTYRCCEDAVRCLQSIRANSPSCDYKIVVVDNDSRDGTVEAVRPLVDVMIVNARNEGFARAVNRGVDEIDSEYVLLFNPDARLTRGAIDALLAHLEATPRVAVAAPVICDGRGRAKPLPIRFPSVLNHLVWGKRFINFLDPISRESFYAPGPPVRVDFAPGSCLLIKRTALRPGAPLFDPDFFMFAEEEDLCWRLRKRGYETHLVRDARAVHLGGGSSKVDPVLTFIELQKSYTILMRKHFTRARAPVVAAAWGANLYAQRLVSFMALAIFGRTERWLERARLFDTAFRWFVRNAPRTLRDPRAVTVEAPWEAGR